MVDELESDARWNRSEIATYLGRLAAALDGDGDVQLAVGDDVVTLAPPAECDFEVEVETEEGRQELELEIEWDAPDADLNVEEGGAGEGTDPAPDPDADEVEEIPPEETAPVDPESRARFELFEDRGGEWRWRLRHDNGNVIADSGEGYSRKANALKGLRSVKRNASAAPETEE